jgi:hypothetical protein
MPQSSPPPFYSSGSPSGSAPTDGSSQRMAIDNILRRELRVSDPSDPNQIAQALLTRYKDSPRARAISQEAKGLPFLQAPMQALVPQAATSSDAELQQVRDDVDRDLHELTTSSLLKDVTPEIQGWRRPSARRSLRAPRQHASPSIPGSATRPSRFGDNSATMHVWRDWWAH